MSETTHFPKFSIVNGNIKIDLDFSRFEEQFQEAQEWLDKEVMNSMEPFMPKNTGTFINLTRAKSVSLAGSGLVCAAFGVYGRFLYEGKVMVDKVTGKGPRKIPTGPGEYVWRFRKGAELKATKRPLNYSKHANPNATDHWFDAAKNADCKVWVDGVKKIAGGG